MASSLPIGNFPQATHMSIKTLRHYHRVGLLEPADVDQFTGHRRYTTQQVPTAQVIRRFRELDMPIEEIRGILTAPDLPSRNQLIAAHLSRLEAGLLLRSLRASHGGGGSADDHRPDRSAGNRCAADI
jgi:DNA-binding transcriptional MerR regulator